MELTIDEALSRGVAAHRDGKLQAAEGFYRAILQSHPKHPDANHNLGLIAVSMNKSDAALPLFETALEASPNVDQFWLSYIAALTKADRLNDAKQQLIRAKKLGVDGEKLSALEAQLAPSSHRETTSTTARFQQQVSDLSEHYQNGQFVEAEKLAVSMTQEFSDHPFGWKVLGAVLKKTGRIGGSLSAMQKTVQLEPGDAEAHSNLGVTLRALGKLNEAEASYKQSLALKPGYVQAHYNLGITLQELGRLDEAAVAYRRATTLKPDFAQAHSNLGITLKSLGRLDEAEASYNQAIELAPDYAKAHTNLGITLQEMGRLDEAKASFTHAITLQPDDASARHLLAALSGNTTTSAPLNYIEGLFDNYALKFESALVGNLEYKMHAVIAEMITSDCSSDSLGSIIDLGCGTGLFGTEIKQFCEHLEGVDLSQKMLEQAKKKDIYNELIKHDILGYLASANLDFDYFVATDVFVYIGDLTEVFHLVKSRNKKSGKLAFSTEDHDGDGFSLQQSGRYSHSKQYIEGLCGKFGYELRHFETQALRKENNQVISGALYLLDF
jgi:predicted TPR repeat methyltransferase